MNEKKVYQLEETLKEMKSSMSDQHKTMSEMGAVLKEIGETMKSFSKISEEQIRQKMILKRLGDESKDFKEFMKRSSCQTHSSEIKALKNSNGFKNTGYLNLITSFFMIVGTALATWFLTHK